MDFIYSEEHQAVAELAAQIIGDRVTPDALTASEMAGEFFDTGTWAELAKANLLGVSLSEDVGGSGLGFGATALILTEVGRRTALLPVLPTVVMAAMAVDTFGGRALASSMLPGVIAGDCVLTAALVEQSGIPARPATRATPDGDGWRLDGTKICVPYGTYAHRILVPASTEAGGVGVFVLDPSAPGVTVTAQGTTDGIPEAHMELSEAPVGAGQVLGDPVDDPSRGVEIVEWIGERALAGLCCTMAGVAEEAIRLTAEYTNSRKQFGQVIGSFQAVGARAADAYIDTEAIRLTSMQAAWRLDAGMDAARAVSIAKYWAAEGGQRVVLAAQHLHGGMGVDRDYPLHRYFLWAKKIELTLGGAAEHLARLGAILAEEPA